MDVRGLASSDLSNIEAEARDPSEDLAAAISYNNLSVLHLQSGNHLEAFKASKKASLLMEPLIFKDSKIVNQGSR
jgi:hypothetical protein